MCFRKLKEASVTGVQQMRGRLAEDSHVHPANLTCTHGHSHHTCVSHTETWEGYVGVCAGGRTIKHLRGLE